MGNCLSSIAVVESPERRGVKPPRRVADVFKAAMEISVRG
jgi:hypothetical protein